MTARKEHDLICLYDRLKALGIDHADVAPLLRIQKTLHAWAEQECGDCSDYASWCIERDEATGKPYRHTYYHRGGGRSRAARKADAGVPAPRRVSPNRPARMLSVPHEQGSSRREGDRMLVQFRGRRRHLLGELTWRLKRTLETSSKP
jgi:hypothetical protein